MRLLPSLLVTLAAGTGAASAMSVDLVVFGDSLSDPYIPSAETPAKQATNGDTWAVQIGATSPEAGNFAQSGAVALSDGDPATEGDFAGQIEAYGRSGLTLDPGGTAYVWFGGNDAADAANEAAPVALSGGSETEIARAIDARIAPAVGDVGNGLTALADAGVENFVVFTAPDIGLTPLARSLGIERLGSLSSAAFNAGLLRTVGDLSGVADISLVDTNALFEPVLSDPDAYGITEIEETCLANPQDLFGCDGYAFFDPFHPTEQVHTIIAGAARAAATGGGTDGAGGSPVSPVPVPASAPLLLAGLGLAGLACRRRAA